MAGEANLLGTYRVSHAPTYLHVKMKVTANQKQPRYFTWSMICALMYYVL